MFTQHCQNIKQEGRQINITYLWAKKRVLMSMLIWKLTFKQSPYSKLIKNNAQINGFIGILLKMKQMTLKLFS